MPIASISKLMTAMVVLDAKLDMQEVIAIGDDDVDGLKGTRSRLPVGTTMTRETAMLLALMSSREPRGACAWAVTIRAACHAFVQAMNQKAQALGMVNSRFEEPTGLSSNNVSTAHDLARMVAAAARYPEIRAISRRRRKPSVELNGHGSATSTIPMPWCVATTGKSASRRPVTSPKPVAAWSCRPGWLTSRWSSCCSIRQGKMTRVGDANRIKRWMESASLTLERRPV